MKKLSVKQKKFADEYIKTGNRYQSALKAGYSETIAKGQSYKFIENLGIKEYIHAKTDKIIKKKPMKLMLFCEIFTGLRRETASPSIH